MGRKVGVKMI